MNSRTKGRRLDGYYPEYVLFDIETTGLSPATDEIIELSAVKVSRGDIIDTFDTLIRSEQEDTAVSDCNKRDYQRYGKGLLLR